MSDLLPRFLRNAPVVRAAKITEIIETHGKTMLVFGELPPLEGQHPTVAVDAGWAKYMEIHVGSYYLKYDNGVAGILLAKNFEGKYMQLEDTA